MEKKKKESWVQLLNTFTNEKLLLEKSNFDKLDFPTHEDMIERGEAISANMIQNISKNRYSNIFPFEAFRVPLKTSKKSDFINASFVQLSDVPNIKYIVTQAPLHPSFGSITDTTGKFSFAFFQNQSNKYNMLEDFWRMNWEQNIKVIVNLARLEKGFSGSSLYWPTKEKISFGDFEILLLDEKPSDSIVQDVVIRTLELKNKQQPNSPSHRILQLHYIGWPNYGVPSTSLPLIKLIQHLDEYYAKNQIQEPILVHCSGGVGRSGVFVTVHSRIQWLRNLPEVPSSFSIVECIKELRKQRHPWMVETDEQYFFCYKTIFQQIVMWEGE